MQENAETRRLGDERRQAILRAMARDGKVLAARLVSELGVSEDTVRRDLRDLAARGLVQRVHGGALPPAPQPGSFAARSELFSEEKEAIARAAVAVVADARVLMLDGSTTNLALARLLPPLPGRTVVTNSPAIATAVAAQPGVEVVVIGGRLDTRALVTVGAAAVDAIRAIRADACVLGVCALHPEEGLSTDDLEESAVKRAMIAGSADVVALATADKLRAASGHVVAPARDVTHLVAGADAADGVLDEYRALGLTVVRA